MTTSVSYLYGVDNLQDDVANALRVLAESLTITNSQCPSHTVLVVDGFGPQATLHAVAVYLVGAIAQCVQADLSIRAALFDEETQARDLIQDVVTIVGAEDCDDTFKTMKRDPWLWEGISHLIVHLALSMPGFHPSGQVLAKTQLKYDVNDHGLDLVAVYDGGVLGITAGESKAYLDNPGRAIIDAAGRLREIDENLRDVELRSTITQLRPSLSEAAQQSLGGAFWRSERTYYPFVCCDHTVALDWTRRRTTLERLNVPVARKFLLPLSIQDARRAFDIIADLMRQYAAGETT